MPRVDADSSSTNAQKDWYKDFFHGVTLDFWRAVITPEQTRAEVEFVIEALGVKKGAHLVDVPCGNGRHAMELAKRGYRVTGIDISGDYIQEANSKASDLSALLTFVEDDMRNIRSANAFDGGYCLGDCFGYLDHHSSEEFLKAVSKALKPDSKLVIDTSMVAECLIPNLHKKVEYNFDQIQVQIENSYHAESSCLETTYYFTQNGLREVRHSLHWVFTAGEINRMLGRTGFRLLHLFGSLESEPFKIGADRLLVVAQKV